ncbi:MAG: helix-turn-helix transcriptional regulator [Bryobacteraceae bacterium]|nr:helix-turn-helix transcriptional regulator [Bryobacteraceae bacterium]
MPDDTSPDVCAPVATETGFSASETPNFALSDNEGGLVTPENGEETVRRILSSYEIGQKIRQLRLRKKIGLVDLGKHTGLSASMLSQLENGKLLPTLSTLARIAMVFDVSLDHFFADRRRRRPFLVVRQTERMQFPDRPTSQRPDYYFECLAYSTQEKSLQAYMAEFPKRSGEDVTDHYHEGAEFLHILEGSLIVRYQGEDHILNAGDSVYFDSSEPHAYRGNSRSTTRAVVVTTPPRL